jgi:hypothetical protein
VNYLKCFSHTTWESDQVNLLRIFQMIIISTIRYGEESYGSASNAVLKKLEHIHKKGMRLALGMEKQHSPSWKNY